MRGGKTLDAIDVYLKILTIYPVYKMLSQFKLLFKDRPSFLGYTEDNVEDEIRLPGGHGSSQSRTAFVPDSIIEFDAVLGKACRICQVNDLDHEQRMKAWFQILRYLQNFMIDSHSKVSQGLETAKKVYEDLSMANLHEDNKENYIKDLKDFVMTRINYILRYPGLDIPLKMIVEQLNLTFEQIQQLSASKLRHNATTLRIEKCSQMITVDQLCDLFLESADKMVSFNPVNLTDFCFTLQ